MSALTIRKWVARHETNDRISSILLREYGIRDWRPDGAIVHTSVLTIEWSVAHTEAPRKTTAERGGIITDYRTAYEVRTLHRHFGAYSYFVPSIDCLDTCYTQPPQAAQAVGCLRYPEVPEDADRVTRNVVNRGDWESIDLLVNGTPARPGQPRSVLYVDSRYRIDSRSWVGIYRFSHRVRDEVSGFRHADGKGYTHYIGFGRELAPLIGTQIALGRSWHGAEVEVGVGWAETRNLGTRYAIESSWDPISYMTSVRLYEIQLGYRANVFHLFGGMVVPWVGAGGGVGLYRGHEMPKDSSFGAEPFAGLDGEVGLRVKVGPVVLGGAYLARVLANTRSDEVKLGIGLSRMDAPHDYADEF